MASTSMQWLGTAGFKIQTQGIEFAFDPFLSRRDPKNSKKLSVKDFSNTRYVFLGHGHFDHIFDIPEIARNSDTKIFASPQNVRKMISLGIEPARLLASTGRESNADSQSLTKDLTIKAFESRHVRFDWPLVTKTLRQCGLSGCLHVLHLGVSYPAGGVRTYFFEAQGQKILFVSSAGCSQDELKTYAQLNIDVLLVPLQGHSQIQKIASDMTMAINPKMVVPHHHDNFYAPMSQEIDLDPFRHFLKKDGYRGDFVEIPLFETLDLR